MEWGDDIQIRRVSVRNNKTKDLIINYGDVTAGSYIGSRLTHWVNTLVGKYSNGGLWGGKYSNE